MNIGFLMRAPKGMLKLGRQAIGEELYAESLCKELRRLNGVKKAQVYAPNFQPSAILDVMIHLNHTMPGPYARKHVLYMQNFYEVGSDVALKELQQFGYDGYAFFSRPLLEIHQQAGYNGIFLPLGADTDIFRPHIPVPHYDYEVVYVGNDIKGEERAMQYIYPGAKYKFGLFGNWKIHNYPYSKILANLSQGTISQEESAVLYSSSKIILNCTGQDSIQWDAMNLRFFEVLACKGFLLSDKVPSAQQELKDCVVFTDGGDDLANKIDYYLSRPIERKKIADNGYQYALEHATTKSRAQQLYLYLKEIMSS